MSFIIEERHLLSQLYYYYGYVSLDVLVRYSFII